MTAALHVALSTSPRSKTRHPLGGVVEASGLKLRGRGRVRQGVCPFHEETEGSFTVYADTQRFYCFGCGLGGDVLDFIQRSRRGRFAGGDPAAATVAIGRRRRRSSRLWSGRLASVNASLPATRALLTVATRFYATEIERSPEAQRYLVSSRYQPGSGPAPRTRLLAGSGVTGAPAGAGIRRRAARRQRTVHRTRRTVPGDGGHSRTARRLPLS